jgi:hypothetical protein
MNSHESVAMWDEVAYSAMCVNGDLGIEVSRGSE